MSVEQKLSEAMRTAMADVRPPAGLAVAGLARGRRARRRARVLRTGGAVLGVSAIAIAGVTVPGNEPERNETLTPSATASPTPPGGPVTHEEMARTLEGLLPDGGELTVEPPGSAALVIPGLVKGRFDDGKGPAAISLSVRRHAPEDMAGQGIGQCPPPQIRPFDDCEATRRPDGSVLVVDQGFTRPQSDTGEKLWYAELSHPGGLVVHLEQVNSPGEKNAAGPTRPDPPLTPAQMTAVVTSPSWNKVAARLPAPERQAAVAPEHPGGRLMATLRRLLPAGGKITHASAQEGHASLIFGDAEGTTTLDVNVQTLRSKDGRPATMPDCAERIRSNPVDATCTKRTLPDGTLVYLQQHAAEVPGSGVTVRIVDVVHPDGLRVAVTAANGLSAKSGPKTRATPAFTLERLRTLATDPGWRG